MSTETRLGQAAPLVVAMEAILAACPPVAEVEAVAEGPCEGPWLLVMTRGSLSFQASPGGLPVPVGSPVLSCSCVFSPGGLSMYCPVCLAPEGSLYPLTSPGNFVFGGKRVPAVGAGPRGPRPRPQGPPAMASWAPCTAMASWAPSYAMASWAPCTAMASWAPCTAMASWAPSSAMASFVCLFRSGGPRPVFLSMSVLRGLQSAHPPLPGGTVTAWDMPSGRGELCQGSVVCVICSCLLCPYLVCFLSLFHVIMS